MPEKYLPIISREAQKYGLDPYVILAISRVESSFDEHAVSSAGAMGVMQIMPKTGEWIAEMLSIQDYTTEDLLSAELNISFGAYYLSYLQARFSEDWCVFAAYNAGEGVVKEWISDGIDLETIPFSETKEYVRRVDKAINLYKKKKIAAFN